MYKVVYTSSGDTYPYKVLRRKSRWHFWKEIKRTDDRLKAERAVFDDLKNRRPDPGEVVFMYDESDYVVDKLKGTA